MHVGILFLVTKIVNWSKMNVAGYGHIKLIVSLWKVNVARSSHSAVHKSLHLEMTGSEAV